MKTIHAFAFGFAVLAVGCAAPTSSDDDLGTTTEALTLRSNGLSTTDAKPTAQIRPAELGLAVAPPVVRQILRPKSHDCDPIVGVGGQWNGAALTSAIGASTAFCTFAWQPAGKNSPADWTALSNAAETDAIRSSPFIVEDDRPSNTPAGSTSLGAATSFTALLVGGGGPGVGSAFTVGSATPTGAAHGLDLTAHGRSLPEGVSGCEVCQEHIGNYIFAVLPPEAFVGGPLVFKTETATYPIGPISSPIFYFPAPATYEGWSYISWE